MSGNAFARRQGVGPGPTQVLASTSPRHRGMGPFPRGDGPWWGGGWGTAWDPSWNQSLVIVSPDDAEDDPDGEEDTSSLMAGSMMGLGGMTSRPCCRKCAGGSGSCSRGSGALGALGALGSVVHAVGDITSDILTSPIALLAAGGLVYLMVTHKQRHRSNPARRRRAHRRSRRSRR